MVTNTDASPVVAQPDEVFPFGLKLLEQHHYSTANEREVVL